MCSFRLMIASIYSWTALQEVTFVSGSPRFEINDPNGSLKVFILIEFSSFIKQN